MKTSYKAALLSIFVFPGVGHLYLKKYWRGLVIMFIALSGMGFMIWSASTSAFSRLDSIMVTMQGGRSSLQDVLDTAGSKAPATSPYHDAVFYVMVCLWIFAIIDSYKIGRRSEAKKEPDMNGRR
jgi:hypothetical protein